MSLTSKPPISKIKRMLVHGGKHILMLCAAILLSSTYLDQSQEFSPPEHFAFFLFLFMPVYHVPFTLLLHFRSPRFWPIWVIGMPVTITLYIAMWIILMGLLFWLPDPPSIGGLIAIIIALSCYFAFAVPRIYRNFLRPYWHGVSGQATITDIEIQHLGRITMELKYVYTVIYEDAEHKTYTSKFGESAVPCLDHWQVGDVIPILYDPASPRYAIWRW